MRRALEALGKRLLDAARLGSVEGLHTADPEAVHAVIEAAVALSARDGSAALLLVVAALLARPRSVDLTALLTAMSAALARAGEAVAEIGGNNGEE